MRFVETHTFTRAIRAAIDDESYRALQIALMLRLEREQSSKVRVDFARYDGRAPGPASGAANEQGDLTAAQVRVLGALVREEFK